MLNTSDRILADDIAYLRALVEKPPLDASHLHETLREIYHSIFLVDLRHYTPEEVRAAAPRLLNEIFGLRNHVRAQIPEWTAKGLMTHETQAALRDCFRASRYAGDMIGEVFLDHPRLGEGQSTFAGFAGADPNLLINQRYAGKPLTFEPGDVILQRGQIHNSAAIARIGDVDSQFSHVGIVARNSGGSIVVVEALIESGASINALDKNLSHHLGRAVLFRHRDRALAERAAQRIYDHVNTSLQPGASPILYDFTMELKYYDELFCSKLVRYAYDMASDGKISLPPFPTLLNMKNRDFANRIGVTARTTFAPGDMELDPNFDVVAEWRDFRVTSELRLKDLIMTKLFEWMDEHGYKFRPDFIAHLIAIGGRLSTRLSKRAQELVASVTGGIVPPNMSGSAISAVAMLHKTAEPIYRELEQLEAETIRNTGRQLHPRQVYDVLEQIRLRSGRRIGYLAR